MTWATRDEGAVDGVVATRGDDAISRALVLGADPALRATCRQILERVGAESDDASDLEEALRITAQSPPDLLILDADACQDSGWTSWIRRLEDHVLREIPTVLLVSTEDELPAMAEAGSSVEEWVVKPVRAIDLVIRIRLMQWRSQRRRGQLGLREIRAEQARMWDVLLDFSRSTGRTLELEAVLDRLVMAAAEMTCSRRVSLMLPDENQEYLTIARSLGIDDETIARVRLPIGDAIAGQAFKSQRRLTSADLDTEEDAEYIGRSFVSMPITAMSLNAENQSLGVLNITQRYGDRPFEDWELEFIDLLGGVAGSVIDDTIWRQARESLLKYERDLQLARGIQQNTFPKQLPSVTGFDLAAWSQPAEETGGDTFDIIGIRHDGSPIASHLSADHPDRVYLLLADATGHGIGPALCVTQLRSMLRMAARMETDLARIMCYMNEQLTVDLPRGRFITAWLGELEVSTGAVTSVSAGQAPILIYRAATDELEVQDADTIPLGILPDLSVTEARSVELVENDIILVISDGIFEAEGPRGEQFGVDRVAEVVRANRDEAARRILDAIWEAVVTFAGADTPSDDRTAIVIKRGK